MKPGRLEFLSSDEVESIRSRTLEILKDTGIRVTLKKMRDLLSDHGCTVNESSRIVKFPADLVEQCIRKAPSDFVICGADPAVRFPVGAEKRVWAGLGTAFRMLDTETGETAEATHGDVEKHLILFDHLDNVSCNQMDIWAQDLPMHTIHVEAIRTWALQCTKSIGMGAYGVMATTDMMEMVSMVMGGRDRLKENHPFCGIVSIESPLSSTQAQLEGLMILGEHHMPALVSPEAMAGTTAPAPLAGLLLQHNTEIIAHVVMAQVANPGAPVMYGTVSTIADMKSGFPALGSIETGMISAASAQLARSYNLPVRTVAGATDAKMLDVQCGFERAQSMLLAAMGGADYITCVGTLESTNLGAHEMAVIDNEIIGRIERALEGIDVNETLMAAADIQRVGPGGNYLLEPLTLEKFKSEHFIPRVSDRDPMEAWKTAGSKGIADHARAEVSRILLEHTPVGIDPKLKKALNEYVESVKKRTVDDFEAAEWGP
ncbi:MAG: trimethylamine methyltransferase family protein [Deltaproteobacteria bacterium]|nr:trimethylamine methyltransferase family protein [Deltaproteobacteria bacterium]